MLPTLALLFLTATARLAQGQVLSLVHWSDLHGRFVPASGKGAALCLDDLSDPTCHGGLRRLAGVCKGTKASSNYTLCLDGGDMFSGTYWPDVDTQLAYIEAMNTFVDATVVGNHDFDKGIDYLANVIDAADFPVLGACNMNLTAEPRLQGKIGRWAEFGPFTDAENGDFRIAVFGVTNADESKHMTNITGNITFYEPTATTHSLADCMREFDAQKGPGRWLAGILSHGGIEVDETIFTDLAIARSTASWLVGGHTHEPMHVGKVSECTDAAFAEATQSWTCTRKGTDKSRHPYPYLVSPARLPVLHSGWAGEYAGVIKIDLGFESSASTIVSAQMLPMRDYYAANATTGALAPASAPSDSEVESIISGPAETLQAYSTTSLGTMPLALPKPGNFSTDGSKLGAFTCDAMMWIAMNLGFDDMSISKGNPAIMCMQDSDTMRVGLPEGQVTVADTEKVFPLEEGVSLAIVELTHHQVWDALENAVSTVPKDPSGEPPLQPDGRFVNVGGGLTFTFTRDADVPAAEYDRANGKVVTAGKRVTEVKYDCATFPRNDTKIRLVTNSQMLLGVNDFWPLKEGEVLLTHGPPMAQVLGRYIRAAAAAHNGEVEMDSADLPPRINPDPNTPCTVAKEAGEIPLESPAGPAEQPVTPDDLPDGALPVNAGPDSEPPASRAEGLAHRSMHSALLAALCCCLYLLM